MLLEQLKKKIPFLKRTLLEIDDASHSVPEHVAAIADQIKSSTAQYIRALREREEQLLDDLDAMREYKATVLVQQKEKVKYVGMEVGLDVFVCVFVPRSLVCAIIGINDYLLTESEICTGNIEPCYIDQVIAEVDASRLILKQLFPEVEVNCEIYSNEPRSGEVNILH